MSKVTKRPRRVVVHHYALKAYRSAYKCPTCKRNLWSGGPDSSVTRFKCSCGQELIIDKHIKSEGGGEES